MKFSALLLVFTVGSAFAQTKSIYLKRFTTGLSITDYFEVDKITSNFGAAPERWVRNSKLEKVQLINDSTAVMITSSTCVETFSERQEKWAPGSDTVVNHPVFSAPITVDSMREVLATTYYFDNEIEEVEFEGFDDTGRNHQKKSGITGKSEKRTARNSSRRPYPEHDIALDPNAPKKRHPIRTWILAVFFGTAIAGAGKIR